MAEIFISYSRKNEAEVEQLVRILERMRHSVHYDQDHSGGHVWWDAILQDIRDSKLFIIALSYDYLNSYPCSLESAYAQTLGKLILPVMVSQVDFGKLPVTLSRVNIVTFTKTRDEDQTLDLSGAINDLANQPTPPLPNPLPTPPDAPIPRVSILLEQITAPTIELTPEQQESLSSELLDLYLNPDSRANTRFALEKLRERPELRSQYADRIDRLLDLSTRELNDMSPQKSVGTSGRQKSSAPSGMGGLPPVWLMTLAAVVILAGIIGLIAVRSNPGAASTATSPSVIVAQAGTSTSTPTETPTAADTLTASPRPTDTPFKPGNLAAATIAGRASQTAAVASYTKTPTETPNYDNTVAAMVSATDAQATQNIIALYTKTPTPTASYTPSQTFTPTPTPVPPRTDSQGILQVWVPAGCFKMGSDPAKDYQAQEDDQPAHDTCFTKGYWLDQYDVTNAAFDPFVKAGGYTTRAYWSADGLNWKQSQNITGPETGCSQESTYPQQPRVCVSWYEAEAYANWRTKTAKDGTVYRLPTEAEWEYAARGPKSLIYPWGNTFDGTRLNYCDKNCSEAYADKSVDDGYAYTSPVGKYEKGKSWVNAYDMAGNVMQWTADWYDAAYYVNAPKNDPTGPTRGTIRVLRGGSWLNEQWVARSALRISYKNPGDRNTNMGFRLVGGVPSH
jgi:formylglycine-generating enzyme required for sulfatase activity